jgi:hypothetical protein
MIRPYVWDQSGCREKTLAWLLVISRPERKKIASFQRKTIHSTSLLKVARASRKIGGARGTTKEMIYAMFGLCKWPDGNNRAKEKITVEAEATNLASKIDEFVKSKENMMLKTSESKKSMSEKKIVMKQARWETFRELEERRLAVEVKKTMVDLVAEESITVMIDSSDMYSFTKEWWHMRKLEIITRRRLAREDRDNASASGGVAGGATGDNGVA